MTKLHLFSAIALLSLVGVGQAEPTKLHVSTDIITWDKPLTEAQCLEKAKAALVAADAKMTTVTASHAWVGTKTDWAVGVDCLQSYKLNGAYISISYIGPKVDEFNKYKVALSKAMGGKSELYK